MPSPSFQSAQPARISVVIPTSNTRDLTLRCLESIEAQEDGPIQVLVVDDASEDGTAEAVAARFPDVRLLRQLERRGFAASVNHGFREAEGQVLIALNSDTELLPGSLDALRGRFEESERLGVAGGWLSYPDGTPQWSGGPAPGLLWLFSLASGLPALLGSVPGWRRLRPTSGTGARNVVDWVTGAALAVRREVWQSVGPFDSEYRFYCQDLDFCLRAGTAGWVVEVVPSFRVLHHHGATIRRGKLSVAHQNPVFLWTDLVRWARQHRGEEWAQKAAATLRLGGRLRLLGRTLRELVLDDRSLDAWRQETSAYRAALDSISGTGPIKTAR